MFISVTFIQSQTDADAKSLLNFDRREYSVIVFLFKSVTALQAIALNCLSCSLPEFVVRRSKLQGEICGTLLFQTPPPPLLIPSGLSPPRWVACSNSFNSESDINASATSHPKGQFDLQSMSDGCLEESVNQAQGSVLPPNTAACLYKDNVIIFHWLLVTIMANRQNIKRNL